MASKLFSRFDILRMTRMVLSSLCQVLEVLSSKRYSSQNALNVSTVEMTPGSVAGPK